MTCKLIRKLRCLFLGETQMGMGKIAAVGFPDFWQTAHDKFPDAFTAIREMISVQQELFQKPLTEPLHKVIRHIAKMTLNSLGALTTLVLNGYGNDAMKIARGMFEGCVNACYLQKYPSEIDNFLDYHWIRQYRWLKYLETTNPSALTARAAEVNVIKSEFAKVESRFKDKAGRLRGSWSSKSIGARARDVGMGDHYETFYSWASSMHHVDIGALTAQADSKDVDVAPSLEWLNIALITGHMAALRCLGAFNEVASLGMDKEIQVAMDDFQTAWK